MKNNLKDDANRFVEARFWQGMDGAESLDWGGQGHLCGAPDGAACCHGVFA